MKKTIVPVTQIGESIQMLRGQKVLLDFDLTELYGVTGNLNKAVKRDAARFPSDFIFRLKAKEAANLILQFGISRWGGHRRLLYAFTEQGVAMLSSVLRSERAVKVNIAIMRAFVRLRETVEANREVARKSTELEKRVSQPDSEIAAIIDAIRQLRAPAKKSQREIGFHVRETPPRYGARKRR